MAMLGKLRIALPSLTRSFCEKLTTNAEKSINKVTLLGRVGIEPQLRGNETSPVVIFTLATNTNFKYESGEVKQKTDWHRISVFKPYLRNSVYQFLHKGHRVYIDGKIMYGEITDSKGVSHITTTIVAEDVVFLNSNAAAEKLKEEVLES